MGPPVRQSKDLQRRAHHPGARLARKISCRPITGERVSHGVGGRTRNGNSSDGPYSEPKNPPNQIEAHVKENLLGKDVQLVHAVWATPDEIRMVKEVGATISIATTSDMRIGFGLPPVGDFLAVGVPCGISVDTSALIGSSSLFGVHAQRPGRGECPHLE